MLMEMVEQCDYMCALAVHFVHYCHVNVFGMDAVIVTHVELCKITAV